MEIIFRGSQLQEIDSLSMEGYGFPSILLMENAGERMFQAMKTCLDSALCQVHFLIGRGNNGGDGMVIARKMFQEGWKTEVFLFTERESNLSESARLNFQLLQKIGVPYRFIPDWESYLAQQTTILNTPLLIDALLGIGIHSPLRGFLRQVIEDINQNYRGKVFAVDVPSGLGVESDFFRPVLRADHTFTVEFLKMNLIDYPGRGFAGKVHRIPIGFPAQAWMDQKAEAWLVEKRDIPLPSKSADSHKGNYGKFLVLAGSRSYTGAPRLCLSAALRTGVGLIYYAGAVAEEVRIDFPEVIVLEEPIDWNDFHAITAGSGWGNENRETTLKELFATEKPTLVLDADALNLLARKPEILRNRPRTLLTPHIGEFARLIKENTEWVKENKKKALREFARNYPEVSVLLKDSVSLFHHAGEFYYLPWGSPFLARGGSGDLLAGLIGGFASWNPLKDSVFLGTWTNGRTAEILSGDRGDYSLPLSELPRHYEKAWKELEEENNL